ncbi:MAG TPA: hypothetical protein VE465_01245 [Streptosporangiaceae bacterium]|nr:hypothetical protein [Streptosporangiaceae bacterium]
MVAVAGILDGILALTGGWTQLVLEQPVRVGVFPSEIGGCGESRLAGGRVGSMPKVRSEVLAALTLLGTSGNGGNHFLSSAVPIEHVGRPAQNRCAFWRPGPEEAYRSVPPHCPIS